MEQWLDTWVPLVPDDQLHWHTKATDVAAVAVCYVGVALTCSWAMRKTNKVYKLNTVRGLPPSSACSRCSQARNLEANASVHTVCSGQNSVQYLDEPFFALDVSGLLSNSYAQLEA